VSRRPSGGTSERAIAAAVRDLTDGLRLVATEVRLLSGHRAMPIALRRRVAGAADDIEGCLERLCGARG
jgi:hypothetical protein